MKTLLKRSLAVLICGITILSPLCAGLSTYASEVKNQTAVVENIESGETNTSVDITVDNTGVSGEGSHTHTKIYASEDIEALAELINSDGYTFDKAIQMLNSKDYYELLTGLDSFSYTAFINSFTEEQAIKFMIYSEYALINRLVDKYNDTSITSDNILDEIINPIDMWVQSVVSVRKNQYLYTDEDISNMESAIISELTSKLGTSVSNISEYVDYINNNTSLDIKNIYNNLLLIKNAYASTESRVRRSELDIIIYNSYNVDKTTAEENKLPSILDIDWKSIIGTKEFDTIVKSSSDDDILEFIFGLSDEDLDELLTSDSILTSPVYKFEDTDTTVIDEEGNEVPVQKQELAYENYYEQIIDRNISTYSWTNDGYYSGTGSGWFFLEIYKDGSKIDEIVCDVFNISRNSGTLSQGSNANDGGGGSNKYYITVRQKTLWNTSSVVVENTYNGRTYDWAGVVLNGSYSKPAHYYALWSTTTLRQGRFDPWNINYTSYSLDTGHAATTDSVRIQVNSFNIVCLTVDSNRDCIGKINLVRYKNALNINPNGGTHGGYTSTYTLATKQCTGTTSVGNPTRAGYTFAGWSQSGSGGSLSGTTFTHCNSSCTFNTSNDTYSNTTVTTTLTATWTANTYKNTLNYDANGGTGAPSADSKTVTYPNTQSTHTVNTSTKPTRAGYKFLGWGATSNATSNVGTTVTVGSNNTTSNQNKTLYARWAVDSVNYKVQHWQQTVTGADTQNSTNYTLVSADTQTLTAQPGSSVTPAVKTYTGFKSPSKQTVTVASNGSTVVNYYYKRNQYTVTLNKGTGISAVTGGGTYKYGASVTIDATVSSGYNWSQWTGGKPSTTKKYTFKMPNSAVTNTATATAGTYTNSLIYNVNGGTGGPATQTTTVTYPNTQSTFTLSSTKPTKTGYKFLGWFETATGGANITGTKTVGVNNNAGNQSATIYAHWEALQVPYKINHYTQNIGAGTAQNTSNYTLYATDNLTGPSDKTVVANTRPIDGFTAPTKQNITIKPDGTAYINYYYTRNSYTLTLNKGTGIGSVTGGGTYQYGQSVIIDATLSTGYSWVNWTGDKTSTTKNLTITMPYNNISMTANGKANIYQNSIVYNNNNGNGGPNTTTDTVTYPNTQKTLTINSVKPTRTGYTFAGWADTSTATTAAYQPGGSLVVGNNNYAGNQSRTLYAVWTPNKYNNYLAYNANGGNNAPAQDNQTVTFPNTQKVHTVSSGVPTKTGYSLVGWSTSSSATTAEYKAGNTITVGANNTDREQGITLYAVWKANTYKINLIYNPNGGSGAPATQSTTVTYPYTQYTFTLSTAKPTRTGYTFRNWYKSDNSLVGNTCVVGTNYTASDQSETLYAQWDVVKYNISYTLNGGKVSGNPSSYNVETATFTLTNPTRVGYTFTGWTGSNGSTPSKTVTISKGTTGNLSYTANWTPNLVNYKVQHWQQTVTGGSTQNSTNYILKETETLQGYSDTTINPAVKSYTGFTSPSSQTTTVKPDGSLVINYYYTRNSYKLTLSNGTGISSVSGSGTYRFGADISIDATVKTGYTWKNWSGTYTKPDKNTTITMPASDVTETANATPNNYTIVFNPNDPNPSDGLGVQGTMPNSGHTYDTSKQLPKNNFSKVKFVYNGWNTKADGTGTAYADQATVINLTSVANGTVTLYAQWIPQYDLKVDPQAGVWRGSADYQIFRLTKGDSMTIENPIPTTKHTITLVQLQDYGDTSSNVNYSNSYQITENFDKWQHTGGKTWDSTARKWTSTNGDATLTALYKPGTYKLTAPAARQNYDFLGWSTKPLTIFETPGNTTELSSQLAYRVGDTIPVGTDITLYEVWRVHYSLVSDLTRIKKPNKNDVNDVPEFENGEMGILTIDTIGYVNKIEITFPDELSKYDATLNSVHTLTPKLVDKLEVEFNIPLYSTPGHYVVQVKAYNEGGKELYSAPQLIIIGDTVLNQFKTTIR